MKLAELHLGGFGRFEDLTLVFPAEFTLVLGANEAGKTTAAEAILGVLFGFRRNLKHLRDRYRPWRGGRYTASLLLAGEEGRRYLLGRDFEHDRLELFRGQGMRLEPLPETALEAVLLEALGLADPVLFESTLLLRRQDSGLFRRDRAVVSALAGALGLIPGREGAGPGNGNEEGAAPVEEAAVSLPQEGDGDLPPLLQERERLSALAAALEEEEREIGEELDRMADLRARLEEKEGLERELQELRLADLEAEESSVPPGGDGLARAEELAGRIAALEVELRFEEEGLHQYEEEIDLLEREIALTRAKLEGFDAHLLSPEVQGRLSRLIPMMNEHMARLGELFPAADRLSGRLRRLGALRAAGLALGFLAALGSIGAHGFLAPPFLLGGAGLAAAAWFGVLALAIRSRNLDSRAGSLAGEIEKRERELQQYREEIEHLLHGKTLGQYQVELEAKRLYENDLWHLEQTLSQKKAEKGPAEGVERIRAGLDAAKEELAGLLAGAGCRDLAEMRAKAASRPRGGGSPAGDLRAREETILGRLRELFVPPGFPEASDPATLAARRDEIRHRLEEARLRLPELEAEIARRQAATVARNGRMEGEAGPPAEEPALPAEIAGPDPGLSARMEEILAEITRGRYGRIRLEFGPAGPSLGIEDRDAGRFLDPASLSAGTLAQVRLAVHAALAEHLAGGANPPFLLDDPFPELDEERLRPALEFLARLSRHRQIILFTRRRETVRMVGEAGITPGVLELG